MISASDYAEWTELSGLYLRNVSPAECYRTFDDKLTRAGVNVRIVHDFLRENPEFLHLRAWRRREVFEMGEDREWRAERTARAVEAIGASRTAAAMRTIEDDSMSRFWSEPHGEVWSAANPPDPTIESRDKVVRLLEDYVRGQQASLRDDMAKYGDPRLEPGYTRERREAQLQRMRDEYWERESQDTKVDELSSALGKLKSAVNNASSPSPAKLRDAIREVREGMKTYREAAASTLSPKLLKWLERATQFADQHPDLFRPVVTSDPSLLSRLETLGAYDVDQDRTSITLTWDAPVGLECPWARLELSVVAPTQDTDAAHRALDTVDRLKAGWPDHREFLRLDLLGCFANYVDQLDASELRDYERDADGKITEAAILAHVGPGVISVDVTPTGEVPDELGIPIFLRIAWDPEHGYQNFLKP